MKETLNKLINHEILPKEEAKQILVNIANGEYNTSQIAAFLTVYMMRSVTIEELEGFRDALLELCLAVDLAEYDPIDLCGTGGDGKDTFNISTLASFVTAGAGIHVTKHGNYGVSSKCGSSNVMEFLGIKFSNDVDFLKKTIEEAGICVLHAPLFHPAMKNVAPIRRELAVKTFFNMLGPMVNPAFPKSDGRGVQFGTGPNVRVPIPEYGQKVHHSKCLGRIRRNFLNGRYQDHFQPYRSHVNAS